MRRNVFDTDYLGAEMSAGGLWWKIEHPFRIVKRIFGFEKTRYRGLRKNHQRLCVNLALANLYLHRRRLVVSRT